VVVADPGFAPMYATPSRKIKTDKRDARALADACRIGGYLQGASLFGRAARSQGAADGARGTGADAEPLYLPLFGRWNFRTDCVLQLALRKPFATDLQR